MFGIPELSPHHTQPDLTLQNHSPHMTSTWRTILLLGLGIGIALLSADFALGKIYSQPAKLQVRDGLQVLAQQTPNVLAVSSSHGRSFHVLGEVLDEQTAGGVTLTAVPIEAGKVEAMEWVLQHRIDPLITDARGAVRSPLSHLLFGITWWDTCRLEPTTKVAHNVVTHGWTWSHYLRDFATSGANELNRNYVRNLWRYSFTRSALVKTRFAISENFGRFTNFLTVMVSGSYPADEHATTLARWRQDIEQGHECYWSDQDIRALDRFIAYADRHNLDLTVVLFPLKPDTVTELGFRATISTFANKMKDYGEERGFRVVDMTLGVVDDEHFMLDLDHVNADGNLVWSRHALAHELDFLHSVSSADGSE